MAELLRDGNRITVAGGQSSTDATAVLPFKIDPVTGRLLTDTAASANIAIGGTVTSGTTGSVLFVGAGPILSQDNANLIWDNTLKELTIGGSNNWTGQANTTLNITSNANAYSQVNFQNKNSGNLASSDYIAEADNDGVALVGHYIDMGINSSTYANPSFTWTGANDGYLYTSGGNQIIGTDTSGKTVAIFTGGTLAANEIARFASTGMTIGLAGTLTGKISFAGSTSGSIALQGQAVGGSNTLTLPATTDTLVGKATTDTLTNKTLTSPTLTTPVLGTPSSGTLTNCTGLPIAGLVASTSTALGVGSIELGNATDTTIARVSAGVISVEGVTVPTISSTNTFTNKRITRRLTTTNVPGATPTTNSDNVDVMNFTGVGTAITSMTTNLSGTPVDGDFLEFRFLDDGTARAITWGTSFAATTIALPTTTVISTCLRVLFEWRAASSKWECVATA